MSNKLAASKVSFSTSYKKKESVRAKLQELVDSYVSSGDVSTDEELENLLQLLQSSLDAIKMIPFEVYQKSSSRIK